MKMTPELAKRILERSQKRTPMPDRLRTEILMDWLEGMAYKKIMAKHDVPQSTVKIVVRDAKVEAQKVLGKAT